MDTLDNMTVDQIMANWYRHSIEQPGSVDSLLCILRDRLGQSLEHQQAEFGANDYEFNQLRGFGLPRPQAFTKDAHRIAIACKLTNPFAFIRAMVLARKLTHNLPQSNDFQYYQAAFDELEDLDELPDEE